MVVLLACCCSLQPRRILAHQFCGFLRIYFATISSSQYSPCRAPAALHLAYSFFSIGEDFYPGWFESCCVDIFLALLGWSTTHKCSSPFLQQVLLERLWCVWIHILCWLVAGRTCSDFGWSRSSRLYLQTRYDCWTPNYVPPLGYPPRLVWHLCFRY